MITIKYNEQEYKVQKGEKVVAIGSPLGLMNVVSTGIFSAYNNVDGITDIQFTASISSGSSGGALFNNKGEIIGITYASYEAGQNLNLAVPVEFVEALWKEKSENRVMLTTFYDALIPHYTIDYVLRNYNLLKDKNFYLDCWVSSYRSLPNGYEAFCVSSYTDIFDPNQNDSSTRFQSDAERYIEMKMIKVVAYGRNDYIDILNKYSLDSFHNTQRSILCYGMEMSDVNERPYIITDGDAIGEGFSPSGITN